MTMPVPRMLIVEDDRTTCGLMERIFSSKGLEVGTAHTVAEGLALLDNRPDYLVLDIGLPDGDGRELLERIRADGLPTKVAVVTGWGSLNGVEHLRPDVYFDKPVNVEELARRLGISELEINP